MREKDIKIIETFRQQSVAVIGDLILDEYVWGDVERICPEAPVPVVKVQKRNYVLGGAANVAHNIRTLGGQVSLLGVLGADSAGIRTLDILKEKQIEVKGISIEKERPTSQKTRIIARKQQVVRFDEEETQSISNPSQKKIFEFLKENLEGFHIIVVSDYGKGVVSHNFFQELISLCHGSGKRVLVDPKQEDLLFYKGADILTPNRSEACRYAKRFNIEGSVQKVGQLLIESLELQSLVMTLGEEGMAIFFDKKRYQHIPTVAREVFEVSGAGDTVMAGLALALASQVELADAANIANHAAGIVVGKVGTATVTPDELKKSLQNG